MHKKLGKIIVKERNMNLAENDSKHTGDEMVQTILTAVLEIQNSSRFLLKRLNQLNAPNHGACSQTLVCSQDEVKKLESRIVELERILQEKDEAYKELGRQFATLEDKISSLETSAMVLQTDDSKLPSASVRTKHPQYTKGMHKHTLAVENRCKHGNHSAGEREPDSVEREECSPTAAANSVQYSNLAIPETKKSTTEASKRTEAQENTICSGGQSKGFLFQINTSAADESKRTSNEQCSKQEAITSHAVRNINLDNIRTDKNSRKQPVEVISDTEIKSYNDEHFWRYLAKREVDDGRKTLRYLGGVHTVICLDISESMAEGDAWTQATTFLEDYLSGLDNISRTYCLTNEHVAFVTFGHITQVQKRFTNKYNEIRELIGKQKLGGPSPLYGGLILGLAAAGSTQCVIQVNNVPMFPKIIIVTDGRPTEIGQYAGPDIPTEHAETKEKIIGCLEEEFKINHIDTYCVPVGNADKTFIEFMMSVADGRMISYDSGKQLARKWYLTTKIRDPLGLESFEHFSGGASVLGEDETYLSADDKQLVEDIKNDARKQLLSGDERVKSDKYRDIPGKNLAPLGSRVRRGPDWMWNSQDSYGPGTVIGHSDRDQVWVEWDNNAFQNVYRYGSGGYDLLIVEEPRELKPGQKIAVGCIVKLVTKGENCQKGTVIKLDEMNKKATVQWLNGGRGEYSYEGRGKNEIEVCSGFQPFSSKGYVLDSSYSTLPSEKKTSKNKNKTIH